MTIRVLIIGGYGNFGSHIAKRLASETAIQLIVAGRNQNKAIDFVHTLECHNAPEAVFLDITENLKQSLTDIKPDIVIHTSGPYQRQGYRVAKACISQGCHYIDLADGRQFVCGIERLDEQARAKGVLVCSGASSVPCLTSALIDHFNPRFNRIEHLEYGIATAQLTNSGLATTAAVLSYTGKPFKTLIDSRMQDIYGWQDLTFRKFWGLNTRLLGNCDIPDLELFPQRYPELKTIRFKAGVELKFIHVGLWFLSWLVRLRIIPSLQRIAPALQKTSHLFNSFGTNDSGFYMQFQGTDTQGKSSEMTFNIVARDGDGLYIPSMPAVLMCKKLVDGGITESGAVPCIGFISLDEYLGALSEFRISWETT